MNRRTRNASSRLAALLAVLAMLLQGAAPAFAAERDRTVEIAGVVISICGPSEHGGGALPGDAAHHASCCILCAAPLLVVPVVSGLAPAVAEAIEPLSPPGFAPAAPRAPPERAPIAPRAPPRTSV